MRVAVLGAGDYVRIEVGPALARSGLRRAIIAYREPQIAGQLPDGRKS